MAVSEKGQQMEKGLERKANKFKGSAPLKAVKS